jgi:hypothetical protein
VSRTVQLLVRLLSILASRKTLAAIWNPLEQSKGRPGIPPIPKVRALFLAAVHLGGEHDDLSQWDSHIDEVAAEEGPISSALEARRSTTAWAVLVHGIS